MERAFLFIGILCLVGLTLVLFLWDRPLPRCRACGRRHADNSPARIGGYQPCPPAPLVPANRPPRQP